jgi:hypothetical protein
MPSVALQFDVVFVASTPSCVTRLAFSTSPPRALPNNHLGPRALCSERVIVSPSSPLIRPDPPVSSAPPDFPSSLVIQAAFARRSGLGCRRDLPCFGSALLPHVPSPLRREESQGPIPASHPVSIAFLNKALSRLLQHSQHRLPSGPSFRRVNPVFALLRPAWLLALLCRSDLRIAPRPPRTSPPSFPARKSPFPRVGGCYTAPSG